MEHINHSVVLQKHKKLLELIIKGDKMLGWIAATAGGLIKDTQVAIGNAWDTISDEVSSIPEAFSSGYTHGLFTGEDLPSSMSGEDLSVEDHHIDVEDTIAEKHGVRKFGHA